MIFGCTWSIRTNSLSLHLAAKKKMLAEDFEAEKKKLLEEHEADKQKLLAEHKAELEEKENQIYEARQFAQEADKKLRSTEGNHVKAKKILELTAARAQRMEAEADSWRKFLRDLDGQLSRKSSFPSAILLFSSAHYILTYFLRYYR